MRDGAA